MVADGHILIFIRHGKRLEPKKEDTSLTPEGVAMSRAAGDWLVASGLVPTVLVHTAKKRTRETAKAVRERCPEPQPELRERPGGPVTRDRWEALAEEAGSGAAIVAHHSTQEFLEDKYAVAKAPDKRHAVVYVMKKFGGTWVCVSRHDGA